MKVPRAVFVLVQVLLVAVILSVAFIGGWLLLSVNTDTTETQVRAQFTRLQASAQTYFARVRYYDGVCADIGVPSNFRCHNSETAYAVEADIGTGRFLCLDSTGFIGERRVSKGEETSCRQY